MKAAFFLSILSVLLIDVFADTADDLDNVFRKKEYIKAAQMAEVGCSKNDYIFCFALARLYSKGLGVPRDEKKSQELYKKSCDSGFHEACKEGKLSYNRNTSSIEIIQYTDACSKQNGEGCYRLGIAYYKGHSVSQNRVKGRELLHEACNLNYSPACGFLADFYQDARNPDAMEEICQKASKKDCAEAYGKMGYAFYMGFNISKDKMMAFQYYQKGCEGGYPQACYNMAMMYGNGETGSFDRDKMFESLSKACDLGHVSACMGMATTNDGYLKAAALLNESCENGSAKACVDLGEMYNRGRGVPKDSVKANNLFDKACKMDDEDGFICKRLGRTKNR